MNMVKALRSSPSWLWFVATMLVVLAVQSPLVANPGYLSHDELQWGYYAERLQGGFFGNVLWADWHAFQYRPLTFSLWVLLSRHLFEHPYAFHAVGVLMGACNAGMLALLLRRFGAGMQVAWLAALAFALGPYAAYTHGWVGTLADLIWVGCSLLAGLIVSQRGADPLALLATLLLTTVALLAKEAAVVLPALLALAWLFTGRQRSWGLAALAAAVPVGIYLALRLKAILFSPASVGSIYQWSLASIPTRWLEYQLFPMYPERLRVTGFLSNGLLNHRTQPALVGWLLLMGVLYSAGARWLWLYVLGSVLALGPVLILADAANQYAYGMAAVTMTACALAWPHLPRLSRWAMAAFGLLYVCHGLFLVAGVRHAGVLQARFSPALAEVVKQADAPVKLLLPKDKEDRWTYIRLTSSIPSYRGVPIGARVLPVDAPEAADYVICLDGALQAIAANRPGCAARP